MYLWTLPLLAMTLAAQTPSFEVASIRPATPTTPGGLICGTSTNPEAVVSGSESVLATGAGTLILLIADAHQNMVDGLDFPQWVKNGDRFALSVKIPPNTNAGKCREMLRNLLAERFHLVTAIETREVTRLYLKVAKSGLKLKPVDKVLYDPKARLNSFPTPGNVHYTYHATPMSVIFQQIANHAVMESRHTGLINDPSFQIAAGGGVIDETGLTGYYDGSFDFFSTPTHEDLGESLEEALTRQLGLTLELRRAPGKVLVICSSDTKPTEN